MSLLLSGLFLWSACSANGQPSEPEAGTNPTPVHAAALPDSLLPSSTDGGRILLKPKIRTQLLKQDSLWAEALRIHYNAIVMDGHVDVPTLMMDFDYDFGIRHVNAHVDLPRMLDGGLDAPFFSIYVPAHYPENESATNRARAMITEVKRQIEKYNKRCELAITANDVRRITRSGKKAILMGIEGGHALAGSAEVLQEMSAAGVRYVTLTHVNTNSWADASQSRPRWNGLNDLGRTMIREMNRLGILVDLSHVSDATFYDAIAVSQVPVIASHSSARGLVNSVRNMDDDMIRAVAETGGVVMINFFDLVVNTALDEAFMAEAHRRLNATYGGNLRMIWDVVYKLKAERGIGRGSMDQILDHIDYVARLAGVDHVALGSDFDGARMPLGMDDATRLPWITYGLLKRGYSEEDLYKILGGNTLRVMESAEEFALLQIHVDEMDPPEPR